MRHAGLAEAALCIAHEYRGAVQEPHGVAQHRSAAAVRDQCLRTHHATRYMPGKGWELGLMLSESRLGLLLLVCLAGVIRVRRWFKQFQHPTIADRKHIGLTTLANGLLELEAKSFTVDKDVHRRPPRARLAEAG